LNKPWETIRTIQRQVHYF